MTWEVELLGDSTDLQILAGTFAIGEVQVVHSGNEHLLRSSKFHTLDSAASVRESAIDVVTALSASARLVFGAQQSIRVGKVYRLRPDGKRDVTLLVEPAVAHERALPITVVHGTQVHRPADPIQAWLPLASQDPVLAKALRLRNTDALDWVDLYRLYELIQSDAGHLIHELGWASRNEVERFVRTANSVSAAGDSARHGTERTDPPLNPTTLAHACELVDRILRAWLDWKANQRDAASAT
jgi:hypothetical protein